MQHLNQLLAKLIEAEVEFVVVGGLAAAIHGSPLTTRDLDVCLRFSPTNLQRLESALEGLHPLHRMRPDLPFHLPTAGPIDFKNLYLKTDLGILDCLGAVLGVGDYEEVAKHSTPVTLPIGTVRLLDMETLIRAKEAMGRPHDLITVAHLQAILRNRPSAHE